MANSPKNLHYGKKKSKKRDTILLPYSILCIKGGDILETLGGVWLS
jgi:hypothetical protein